MRTLLFQSRARPLALPRAAVSVVPALALLMLLAVGLTP